MKNNQHLTRLGDVSLRFWLQIQEPRIVSLMQFVVYLSVTTAGVLSVAQPPASIDRTAGDGLTLMWSSLLLFGGIVGMATVLPGWWLFERIATTACLGATLIYAVNLFFIRREHFGDFVDLLPSSFIVLVVAFHFAIRLFSIRRYAYDPERG